MTKQDSDGQRSPQEIAADAIKSAEVAARKASPSNGEDTARGGRLVGSSGPRRDAGSDKRNQEGTPTND